MSKFVFTVGDWSDDGHGEVEQFHIQSNYLFEDVKAANDKLNKEYPKFDKWFEDYEQDTISDEDYKELVALLPEASDLFEIVINDYDDEDYRLKGNQPETYVELWIALMQEFTRGITLERTPKTRVDTIHGGGYGLFVQ